MNSITCEIWVDSFFYFHMIFPFLIIWGRGSKATVLFYASQWPSHGERCYVTSDGSIDSVRGSCFKSAIECREQPRKIAEILEIWSAE